MPALAACYFCGDAVGASLEEHAIPLDAPVDDQVSVTLCADCHSKLTALLEELPVGESDADDSSASSQTAPDESKSGTVSAIDDEAADEGTAESASPGEQDTPDATDSSEVDTVSTPGSETGSATGADPDTASDPASDPDVDPLSGEQEPIFAGEDGTILGEDAPDDEPEGSRPFSSNAGDDAQGSVATAGSNGPDEAADADDPIAAPPAEERDAPDSEAESATDPRDATPDDPGASAVEVSTSSGGSTNQAGSDPTDATADRSAADGPLADVSPRTYNRVVRLLQNREFPVDRADFEALATSAYELDHGECAAALDGAIEKGLLEERDGELHRPE
jgi:hypothetical protein